MGCLNPAFQPHPQPQPLLTSTTSHIDCTGTPLVFEVENMNSDSRSPEAGLSDDADNISPALLSGQEHEDGDGSCENSDDEYVLEDTDDDDYYESDYAISNSSRGGGIKSQNELAAAGNGSDELKAFRAEWLQNLKLSEGIQAQDVKGSEELPHGGGQGDEDNSDGLSVSRLWLGDDYNCYEFEDQPSSGNRVTLGHEMDEFEQEQLLQEEMWKYYAENRNRNGQSNVPSGIPRTVANLSQRAPLLYRVYDNESVSTYTSTGFVAGSDAVPTDGSEFGQMVGNHAQWRSRVPTPFISVTDSQRVVQWQISIRNRPGIMVAIIDTALFVDQLDGQVWEMCELMNHFGVKPPGKCQWKSFEDEYLCGLQIPDCAVLEVCEPEMFSTMSEIYLQGR